MPIRIKPIIPESVPPHSETEQKKDLLQVIILGEALAAPVARTRKKERKQFERTARRR